ncbi:MAG: hypothetical protein AVDCRST_MAG59-1067, partial [uncultured Thermomicrobiales bacterium]
GPLRPPPHAPGDPPPGRDQPDRLRPPPDDPRRTAGAGGGA